MSQSAPKARCCLGDGDEASGRPLLARLGAVHAPLSPQNRSIDFRCFTRSIWVPRPGKHMPPVRTTRLTTGDVYRALDTYAHFGEELFGSSVAIASGGYRRAAHLVIRSLLGPWSTEELATELLGEYRDYVTAMATVAPVAAANAASRLARPSRETLSEFNVSIGGAAPVSHGRTYQIDGKPLLMPSRITDASEAWALWFVPAAAAQDTLGARGDLLRVVDLGGGRTSLTLFGIDHRNTDLGRYLEISVGLCVVPRNDPTAPPGVTSIAVAVNHEYTRDAAGEVWGIKKQLARHMAVSYGEERVGFRLATGERSLLSILYPRVRLSRSAMVPIPLYIDQGRR